VRGLPTVPEEKGVRGQTS